MKKDCSDHSPHTWTTEWVDRRLPFFQSLKSGELCADCLHELEADEFVEITYACPIAN